MMINFNNYYHPTKKSWRKFGDAILYTGTSLTGGGLMAFEQLKELFGLPALKIAIGTALFMGMAGKFISNFFKEDPSDNVINPKKDECKNEG